VYQTFGLRSSVERFFGYLKDRSRAFYNNINPKKTLFMPLVDFLLGGVHCVVHRVEVTRIGLIRTGPVELYYVKRNRAGFRTDIDWNPVGPGIVWYQVLLYSLSAHSRIVGFRIYKRALAEAK